jgi:rod shape determining protein RodA
MVIRTIEKRLGSSFDWPLTLAMLVLCGIGLLIQYSAGYDRETLQSLSMHRQAVSMAMGFAAFLFTALIGMNFFRRWAFVIFIVGCLLLVAVLGMGSVAGGARRWLNLGGFRFQPSEFMKIGVMLTIAKICSSDRAPLDGYTISKLILPAGILLVPFVLTLVQPDLGTALSQALVGVSIILMAGVRFKTLATLGVAGAILAIPAWTHLKEYQKNRILNFLSPEMDPLGTGYHAIQSKIAVGSGALTGKGMLQGTQTQLRFLPEQTTDFLFSVLAEEWGFIGSSLTVAAYAYLLYRILKVTARAEDKFRALVCVGVAALIFWHVFINIGMVTGILPVVGITLPLLSFGGSSVITTMAAIGLVVGVSSRRFLFAQR